MTIMKNHSFEEKCTGAEDNGRGCIFILREMAVTITDVAKDCGVAISTVSHVLSNNSKKYVSEEIRKKVLQSSRKLNYKANPMAKALITKRTNLLGLFLTAEQDKFDGFYMSLISGIATTASKFKMSVVLYLNILGEDDIRNVLGTGKVMVDGAIILTPMQDDFRLTELEHDNVPYVIIGKPNHATVKSVPFVDVRNDENTYLVTKKLLENGHRKILLLNGIKEYTISEDRYSGFKRALEEFGLENAEDYVVNIDNDSKNIDFVPKMLRMVRKEKGITAVIAESNNSAKYVYDFCKEEGLVVGKDFSIASLGSERDDFRFSDLTTIHIDHSEIGRVATEMIVDIINTKNRTDIRERYCDSKIIFKSSTNFG